MYKEVLSGIKDIDIFPVFSFSMFFVFFLLMAAWVIKSSRKDFDHISRIPLSDPNEEN
jgi:hypothetical protein